MTNWQKSLLIGVGWGLGTALGLVVLGSSVLWYRSRPVPPKPWNAAAIKAEYDTTDTEGDNNNIVFYYTLENTTEFDYRVESGDQILMSATLKQQKNLSPFGTSQKLDYPIFVPSKKRIRFPIHVGYPIDLKEKDNADLEERRKYRREVEKYVVDKFGNLDGFDLLDKINRYEIIFPAGWKQTKH